MPRNAPETCAACIHDGPACARITRLRADAVRALSDRLKVKAARLRAAADRAAAFRRDPDEDGCPEGTLRVRGQLLIGEDDRVVPAAVARPEHWQRVEGPAVVVRQATTASAGIPLDVAVAPDSEHARDLEHWLGELGRGHRLELWYRAPGADTVSAPLAMWDPKWGGQACPPPRTIEVRDARGRDFSARLRPGASSSVPAYAEAAARLPPPFMVGGKR